MTEFGLAGTLSTVDRSWLGSVFLSRSARLPVIGTYIDEPSGGARFEGTFGSALQRERERGKSAPHQPGSPAPIGYLSGPVDAREIYRSLREGVATSLFGTEYLQHFMRLCEAQGRKAIIVTTHGQEAYDVEVGHFSIRNRPQPPGKRLRYHLRQVEWVRDRLVEIEAWGARVCVLTAAQHYWLVTPPFRRRGMRFINSYHCAIRAIGHNRWSPHEFFIRMTSWRHLAHGDPTMVIVPTIADELAAEPGASRRCVLQVLPDYRAELFEHFQEPAIARGKQDVVRVMFAGRMTRNKGVYDIVEMARMLAAKASPRIEFHLHGEGDALANVRAAVAAASLEDLVIVHGFTPGAELSRHYMAADIVIAPTRSDFEEGVAKAVVEGVLTLRPVVTSRACPSIGILGDACLEAKVNDPASYADAIWHLANEPTLVAEKVAAARRLRPMFFDPPERYDRRLKEALTLQPC